MKNPANPQFPHSLRVFRISIDSSVYPPTSNETLVMDTTPCRIYVGSSGNTHSRSTVVVSDYTAYLPKIDIDIKVGDQIFAIDEVREISGGAVVQSSVTSFGARIWFNKPKT